MATESGQGYRLSSVKYMGVLREPDPDTPQPSSAYYKRSGKDYSKLAAKLRRQKMER